jgi:hypothetical protein
VTRLCVPARVHFFDWGRGGGAPPPPACGCACSWILLHCSVPGLPHGILFLLLPRSFYATRVNGSDGPLNGVIGVDAPPSLQLKLLTMSASFLDCGNSPVPLALSLVQNTSLLAPTSFNITVSGEPSLEVTVAPFQGWIGTVVSMTWGRKRFAKEEDFACDMPVSSGPFFAPPGMKHSSGYYDAKEEDGVYRCSVSLAQPLLRAASSTYLVTLAFGRS